MVNPEAGGVIAFSVSGRGNQNQGLLPQSLLIRRFKPTFALCLWKEHFLWSAFLQKKVTDSRLRDTSFACCVSNYNIFVKVQFVDSGIESTLS